MSPVPTGDDYRRLREEVLSEIRDLRQSLEAGFQRKDVAQAEAVATALQLKGLEDEVHAIRKLHDTTNKRIDAWETRASRAATARWSWIASSLLGPVFVVVILRALGLVHG